MTFTTYMSGSLVRVSAVFTDIMGVAKDPTTVTLKWQKGGSAPTSYVYPSAPVIRDGAGLYHGDLDTSNWTGPNPQKNFIEWVAAGTVQSISVDYFEVVPAEL